MIDKKEKKRDISVFCNMLKDMMAAPADNALLTLDRDVQNFIYGRIAVLVKHNNNEPIGTLGDVGAVIGAALADVGKEFVRDKVNDSNIQLAFANLKEGLVAGFEARTPKFEQAPETEISNQQ